MSKPFIVIADGFDSTLFKKLQENNSLEVHPAPKVTQEQLKELLPKVNGLVIRSATKVTKEIVDQALNLQYVIRAGEGTDNIDKLYCQEKGIKVSNTPGANSNSAAEHTIALMMTLMRNTAWANESMNLGHWEKSAYTGIELWQKTIGFIGFGSIGQIVAKRLSGFEIKVKYFTRHEKNHGLSYASWTPDMDEVFKDSDIVTLHIPKNATTANLITKKQLSLMKKDALLINCARGGVVNEDDLYDILKEKKIKGAALDVFSQEPLSPDSKLLKLDNLIKTPHLGASTKEAQVRVGQMCVHQLEEFFLHNHLLNEVKA